MTYGQLKDQIGTNGPRPDLHCRECGETYSANAGDYWNVPKDTVIVCGECGSPMVLAERVVVYVPVGTEDTIYNERTRLWEQAVKA